MLGLVLLGCGLVSSAAQGLRPNLGPSLERITVSCGDLTLLLRRQSQWTPGRIDFRGAPMTTERSAYGSVFLFPDVGFIGTAHLENEPEDLKCLAFFLDGAPVGKLTETLKGGSFRFIRESRIRDFSLKSEISLKDNRLYETASVTAREDVALKLVYHFMHAWTPSVSEYLGGSDGAPQEDVSGKLLDTKAVARKFYIQRAIDWVAVYEPKSGQFAVSRLLESPKSVAHVSKIWNVPGTYRKYYLKTLQNQTVPKGFAGTWRMVTAFGASELDAWKDAARKLAGELRE